MTRQAMTLPVSTRQQIARNPLSILLYAEADLDDFAHTLEAFIKNTNPPAWLDGQEPFGAECFDVWLEQRFDTLTSILREASRRFDMNAVAQMYWHLSCDNPALIELGRHALQPDWLNYLHPGLADVWDALSQASESSRLETLRLIVEGETIQGHELPPLEV